MSGQIFISYRCEESEWPAGRLYDRLATRSGKDEIFIDVPGIDVRADFAKEIEKTVSSSDVLIARVDPNCVNSGNDQGTRRLDNPVSSQAANFWALALHSPFARLGFILSEAARRPRRRQNGPTGSLPDG